MAEALLTLIAGDHFEACTAGTCHAGLNPAAVEVMRELGVDIAGRRSKHVNEFLGQQFDYVITVCDRAKEMCPVFPAGSRLLHWSFDDPAALPEVRRRETFVRVRDEIADRICEFCIQEVKLAPQALRCYRCDEHKRGKEL
jgi:arsenate reductase